MPDSAQPDPDQLNQQNADEIKVQEATEHGPRGNVHSEADEPVEQDMPPPLPN